MTKLDLQYDLVNYTPASASPPEANFDRIEQHVNQELIERDGTVAMRAQLKLVGDPVNPLDAAPKQYVDQVLPVGIIMMYGGAAVPPGGRWALCNGAEMETALQPELFAIIGSSYSPGGTPAGRFHLPNLNDRVPLGVGPTTPIGSTGGSAASAMPTHTHTMNHDHAAVTSGNNSVGHTHDFTTGVNNIGWVHSEPSGGGGFMVWRYGAGTTGGFTAGPGVDFGIYGFTGGPSTSHTHSGTTGGISANHTHSVDLPSFTGNTGAQGTADTTRTNLPPYVGVQFIIRIK